MPFNADDRFASGELRFENAQRIRFSLIRAFAVFSKTPPTLESKKNEYPPFRIVGININKTIQAYFEEECDYTKNMTHWKKLKLEAFRTSRHKISCLVNTSP